MALALDSVQDYIHYSDYIDYTPNRDYTHYRDYIHYTVIMYEAQMYQLKDCVHLYHI